METETDKNGQEKQLSWWSAAVRQQLGHFELTSGLIFRPPPDDAGCARLWCIDVGEDPAAPTVQACPLVQMGRPRRQYFEKQLGRTTAQSDVLQSKDPERELENEQRIAEAMAQLSNPSTLIGAIVNIDPSLLPATVELLELTRGFTADICQRFKHALACPRPNDYAARVRPVIQTPAHGTLPMGHAAEAYAVLGVLLALLKLDATTERLLKFHAHRVAENRILLGVHFPIDAYAGRMLGERLADYVTRRCCGTPAQWVEGIFDGYSLDKSQAESHVFAEGDALEPWWTGLFENSPDRSGNAAPRQRPLLHEMWIRAMRELETMGLVPPDPAVVPHDAAVVPS